MNIYITEHTLKCPPGAKRCALEDSIMQKGSPVTAGSKMLESFISPIGATVVSRLEAAGVMITGKTAMDEFGIGVVSPDEQCVPSGAVAAVAGDLADFALCNDFSGNIRRQAASMGVCYIHPTYGTVSRFGLIPAIASMDQLGVVCKTPSEGFAALSLIAGWDSGDGAMFPDKEYVYKPDKTDIVVGIPNNVFSAAGEDATLSVVSGHFKTVSTELPYLDVYSQVMYILGCAELSNNISRYDGIKFGYRTPEYSGLEELYTKSRTEAFGPGVKLAAIMGVMVLSLEYYNLYYDKAMRIRRLIKESLDFSKYDVIAMPVCLNAEPYVRDAYYALPQLAGLPSMTVNAGGCAVQLIAGAKNENVLYSAAEVLGL